jgi:para-aminobenzoate synthetase / 4-amino-4-deoxychorismate lyase
LEPALADLRKPFDFDLAWLGLTKNPIKLKAAAAYKDNSSGLKAGLGVSDIRPSVSRREYVEAIGKIKKYLEEGDTYQVNFTFKVNFDYHGSPALLYEKLKMSQPTAYSAYIDTGVECFLSHSPELFFKKDHRCVSTRPMKGTISRGLTWESDRRRQEELRDDQKTRAENIMIVDLLRNDLGRIAAEVKVPKIFEVEKYKTLHQMTSIVRARLNKNLSLRDLFAGIFPSGSVTGAPKIRTMRIIEELEKVPRGVYTGAVGFLSPQDKACFNVAIRTLRLRGTEASMGVGGGIVYDSLSGMEYEEALLKARFLLKPLPEVGLIETMRFEPAKGFFLFDAHIKRLRQSCEYFSLPFGEEAVKNKLEGAVQGKKAVQKVRLLIDPWGRVSVNSVNLGFVRGPVKVAISGKAIEKNNILLYHKTTERKLYDSEKAAFRAKGFFEVIFFNDDGYLTEGSFTNVFLQKSGQLYTPPVSNGLLPGILRQYLLLGGSLKEKQCSRDDLQQAEAVYIGNSLRGLIRAQL